MRVSAGFFGPCAPYGLTAHVSVFSHDFKRVDQFLKLATSSAGEIRALRRLKSAVPDLAYGFVSERTGPLTDSSVWKMMAQAGEIAALGFPVHPHQLRHGCGFKLANDQQDTRAIQRFLGHRNIQHTVQYTELAAGRFQDFWRDED
jgi:site-specific recombinase XerD